MPELSRGNVQATHMWLKTDLEPYGHMPKLKYPRCNPVGYMLPVNMQTKSMPDLRDAGEKRAQTQTQTYDIYATGNMG